MTKYIITVPPTSIYYRIFVNHSASGFEINTKMYDTAKEALLDLVQITGGAKCKIIVK